MDIAAAIRELIGAGTVGWFKCKWGFVALMFGNVCWLLYAMDVDSRGLYIVGPAFFGVNVISLAKWWRDDRRPVLEATVWSDSTKVIRVKRD